MKGTLPAIDFNGKVLLEDCGRIFMAPNGNGAVYEALLAHGCLEKMYKIKKNNRILNDH
jgi:UDP-N-acetylglucosamine/UDP-N-acetylgalactosamine diphosphorylase